MALCEKIKAVPIKPINKNIQKKNCNFLSGIKTYIVKQTANSKQKRSIIRENTTTAADEPNSESDHSVMISIAIKSPELKGKAVAEA